MLGATIASSGLRTPMALTFTFMRVSHCCADVAMPWQFLHDPDDIAGFEQVGRERMAQSVRRGWLFGQSRGDHGPPEGPLEILSEHVIPPHAPARIAAQVARGNTGCRARDSLAHEHLRAGASGSAIPDTGRHDPACWRIS